MIELALDELIAHQPPMRLLDRVLSVDADEAVAELTVRRDNPLFVPGRGLPAYTGLELMAQTIALIDGWRCQHDGVPPKIGFLLGCRRYATELTAFDDGMTLVISVKMVLCGGDMYSFDAQICDAQGRVLATANLNVYAPKNPEAFLKDGTT
jgi:predicted hotdog family 3-hydroxylacyl-ACP dehydratase